MALSKRARDYGRAILLHSLRFVADSLYSGQNYTTLAHFLGGPQGLQHVALTQRVEPPDHTSVAVLYDLRPQDKDVKTAIRCTKFADDEYDSIQNLPQSQESSGQILFLRGFLSAEWIQTIGAKYRIDPDFFQRHLSFASLPIYESVFALPSLPSSTRNIIRLQVTTVACHDPSTTYTKNTGLMENQTEEESIEMDRYFRRFMSWAKPRDSIVRSYKTLNQRFSIIEQDISICLEKDGKGWIAIIWLDSGRSLQNSPPGPWMDERDSAAGSLVTLPVQQYLKHVALKGIGHSASSHSSSSSSSSSEASDLNKVVFHQSATLLPLQYCRYLDSSAASSDFIYATADVFRFAAHSEVQCLNLIASLIEDTVRQRLLVPDGSSASTLQPTHALLEYKSILDRHRGRLEETLATLRRREQSGWPKATSEPHRRKALNEAGRLEEDYQYLVSRTQELAAACQDAMSMLMNDAIIIEAKKAMEQTERMKRLTMLATFFIPLSFTCSMFGMNVREFGIAGTWSIWVWVTVTLPVVVLTVIAYTCDMSTFKRHVASLKKKWRQSRQD